ncbi:MAG: endonuclease V [Promethearchaeia archaeon]
MIQDLLDGTVSKQKALQLQLKYSKKRYKWEKARDLITDGKAIRFIAGADISYPPVKDPDWGIGCAALWDYKKSERVAIAYGRDDIEFPYIPGFLGFREVPLMAKTILKLKPQPDLILSDGHGIIHPRQFGEATHLGIALDIPSIGVAKSEFIGCCHWKELERIKGNRCPVLLDGQKIGYAVCLRDGSKPVFVSKGFLISLDLAIELMLSISFEHRQPEPLFLADHLSRKKFDSLV